MRRRGSARGGQSILEYLVIVTLIIAAVLAIKGTVSGNMDTLFTNAAGHTAAAAGQLGGIKSE